MLSDLNQLQEIIGLSFKNISLLRQALVHSSFINENIKVASESNERLEFLGDAVLGLIFAEKLYHDLPQAAEGELTRLRAALIRQDTLAGLARMINLGSYLYLGAGENSGGGRLKPANLASAFEALMAAIYIDQGLEAARCFLLRLVGPEMRKLAEKAAASDYKSLLQEKIQSERQIIPTYRVIETSGPEHARHFIVEVSAGEQVLARGGGKSKKAAETAAAKAALEKLAG